MGILWIFLIWSLNIRDKVFAIFNFLMYNDGVTERDSIILFGEGVFMIRNLNSLTFRAFGTVFPEKPLADTSLPHMPSQTVTLYATQSSAPVYRATGETWFHCSKSMTVLSVSLDGKDYAHFYVDKLVQIPAGVYFSISPFLQECASLDISADPLPQKLEQTLAPGDLLLRRQLQVSALYTFFYHEKEQGFFFPGEAHPMFELTYVDRGTLHSVADGQDLILEQGQIAVYGANQWHMQYADIGVAPRYVTISFDVTGTDLAPLLDRRVIPSQAAVTLLQQMLWEQEHTDPYSTDILINQLSMLLLLLLRQEGTPSSKPAASNSLNSENSIIRRTQQFISSHVRDKLSVPYVAKMVDVSPSYLTALFHKHLQISPGEYIRRIKLQESKQMIRENSMNFSEIASALQYSTVHHFSRQFKEKFGITPSEYAKSVR